jgi:hypothetical protein
MMPRVVMARLVAIAGRGDRRDRTQRNSNRDQRGKQS